MNHPARLSEQQLLAECELRFARRSGPGGQHRNKTESAAIFTHLPSGISAEASERRTQADNRRVALSRLRLRLATDLRSSELLDRASQETWESRVSGGRISVGVEHPDYPTMLSIALDALSAAGHDLPVAAMHLGVTSSQIVKLLAKHPPALARLNAQRLELGLPPLKGS